MSFRDGSHLRASMILLAVDSHFGFPALLKSSSPAVMSAGTSFAYQLMLNSSALSSNVHSRQSFGESIGPWISRGLLPEFRATRIMLHGLPWVVVRTITPIHHVAERALRWPFGRARHRHPVAVDVPVPLGVAC